MEGGPGLWFEQSVPNPGGQRGYNTQLVDPSILYNPYANLGRGVYSGIRMIAQIFLKGEFHFDGMICINSVNTKILSIHN